MKCGLADPLCPLTHVLLHAGFGEQLAQLELRARLPGYTGTV